MQMSSYELSDLLISSNSLPTFPLSYFPLTQVLQKIASWRKKNVPMQSRRKSVSESTSDSLSENVGYSLSYGKNYSIYDRISDNDSVSKSLSDKYSVSHSDSLSNNVNLNKFLDLTWFPQMIYILKQVILQVTV